MKEEVSKAIYNEIENPWEFIVSAVKSYKDEFKKTRLVSPPKIDDVLARVLFKELGREDELPEVEPVQIVQPVVEDAEEIIEEEIQYEEDGSEEAQEE